MAESRASRRTSRVKSDVHSARAQERPQDLSRCWSSPRNQFAKLARIDSNGTSTAKGRETLICLFLNTSVRNAITSSKPWSSANSGRNARSATRPSLILSFLCLRFRRRVRRAERRLPAARAVRAAIHAEPEPARSAIWTEAASAFGLQASADPFGCLAEARSQEPEAARRVRRGFRPGRRCKLAGCA